MVALLNRLEDKSVVSNFKSSVPPLFRPRVSQNAPARPTAIAGGLGTATAGATGEEDIAAPRERREVRRHGLDVAKHQPLESHERSEPHPSVERIGARTMAQKFRDENRRRKCRQGYAEFGHGGKDN